MVVLQDSGVTGGGDRVNGRPVSPLRQMMIDDLNLGGYASGTKQAYIAAVVRIGKHFGVKPDKLSESEVKAYLLHMREVEGVAKGTFQSNLYGLKFFYCITLDRDWSLFTKKKWHCLGRSGCRFPFRRMTAPGLSPRSTTRHTVYAVPLCVLWAYASVLRFPFRSRQSTVSKTCSG